MEVSHRLHAASVDLFDHAVDTSRDQIREVSINELVRSDIDFSRVLWAALSPKGKVLATVLQGSSNVHLHFLADTGSGSSSGSDGPHLHASTALLEPRVPAQLLPVGGFSCHSTQGLVWLASHEHPSGATAPSETPRLETLVTATSGALVLHTLGYWDIVLTAAAAGQGGPGGDQLSCSSTRVQLKQVGGL